MKLMKVTMLVKLLLTSKRLLTQLGGGGGGGVVFSGGREMKIFSMVFQDFGKIWSGNGIFNTRRCR